MKRVLEVDCFFCNNLSRPNLNIHVIKMCTDCYSNSECKRVKLVHIENKEVKNPKEIQCKSDKEK